MKGECASMNVQVSASTGAKYVQYLFGTGTNGALSGGNAKVYLGYAAPEDWVRFERNVEADFEAYAGGGATWTNTDGLYISWPKSLLSYAFYVDDLRLSDSLTVEHNTLGPGVIGHILRHTTWDATTLAKTDRWFHYDQVGSVLNESDAAGDDVTRHEQDAFGNVMLTWSGGLWDGGASGWGFQTKKGEMSTASHYSANRWYSPSDGVFSSSAAYWPLEPRFLFGDSNPVTLGDPDGLWPEYLIDSLFWTEWAKDTGRGLLGRPIGPIPGGGFGGCFARCVNSSGTGVPNTSLCEIGIPPAYFLPFNALPKLGRARAISQGLGASTQTTLLSLLTHLGGPKSLRAIGRPLSRVATPLLLIEGLTTVATEDYCARACLINPTSY